MKQIIKGMGNIDIKDLAVGDRIYIKSLDLQGKGEILSLKAGIHVILDAYKNPMYIKIEEVMAVLKIYE